MRARLIFLLVFCLLTSARQELGASSVSRTSIGEEDADWRRETGELLRLDADFFGDRVVVMHFMFTSCPRICPLETARLRQVYQELAPDVGSQVIFLSVSIDPLTDTPEVLRQFKERHRLGEAWSLLHGEPAQIERLQNRLLVERLPGPLSLPSAGHGQTVWVGRPQAGLWLERSSRESPANLARLIRSL